MDAMTNFIGNVTGNQRTNEDGTPVVYAPQVVPILPLRMQGQLPPHPPGPTQFMTDAEVHLTRQNSRLQENQQLSNNIDQGMGDLTGSGKTAGTRAKGLWGVLANGVKKGIVEVQIGASSAVQSTTGSSQHSRFKSAFGHIVQQGGEFHSSSESHVVHQGVSTPCGVFITSTHLCVNGSGLNDAIPYKNIVSVVPCVSLPTTDLTPFLMPCPTNQVIPTGVEVFTRVQTMDGGPGECLKYQFLGFSDSSVKQMVDSSTKTHGPCIKMLADLDKSWRACTQVPAPGVQYQPGFGGGGTVMPPPAGMPAQGEPPMADQPPMGGFAGQQQQRDMSAQQEMGEKESAPLPEGTDKDY